MKPAPPVIRIVSAKAGLRYFREPVFEPCFEAPPRVEAVLPARFAPPRADAFAPPFALDLEPRFDAVFAPDFAPRFALALPAPFDPVLDPRLAAPFDPAFVAALDPRFAPAFEPVRAPPFAADFLPPFAAVLEVFFEDFAAPPGAFAPPRAARLVPLFDPPRAALRPELRLAPPAARFEPASVSPETNLKKRLAPPPPASSWCRKARSFSSKIRKNSSQEISSRLSSCSPKSKRKMPPSPPVRTTEGRPPRSSAQRLISS